MATKSSNIFARQLFFSPETCDWKDLKPENSSLEMGEEKWREALAAASSAREHLKAVLLSSLQMRHIVSLAGSGSSLGSVKGPSMTALWNYCVNVNPDAENEKQKISPQAQSVIKKIGYDLQSLNENIESLLSLCDAYTQINNDVEVEKFVVDSKAIILEKCSAFLDDANESQLNSHRTFLHRLSRRRARDPRMKLFTTNYDLCFEMAAGKQGLVVLDGFSFTQPRQFDPRYFLYDIIRRPSVGDESATPLEGVFHLYKLHGSVNWGQSQSGNIEIELNPEPRSACLIYPAKGKYQQSYVQPYLEFISQYFMALREPNTCLIIVGFGFNDDHLSEPIIAAARTNPHLRLIVVNPLIKDMIAGRKKSNRFWDALYELAKQGEDVWLINATFGQFVEMIPDLKSLTPAQQLTRDIRSLVSPK